MTIDQATALYLDDCRTRHLSEKTLLHNKILLNHFAHFCEIEHLDDLREATEQTILDFHRWIKTRKRPDGEPISIKHQNRHVRTVKLLFKLLAKRNRIMRDIGQDIPPLRDPKTLPRGIMTKDQVMKLLQQPYMTTPLGFRDRVILEVLYSTALRAGELCRLTLYDLDLQARMIRVLGKGRKERIVPIGKVACGYLSEYLNTVRPILLATQGTSLVFLSATGHKLYTNDLYRMLKTYRDKAALPDNITTHSLRHTCATEMLKGGASIRHVQELLGHADIMTTQVYTHVVPTDLQKAHARTAPSERRKTVDVPEFNHQIPRWNDKRNIPYWPKVHGPAAMSKIRRGGKKAEEEKPKRKRKKTRKRRKNR